MLQPSMQTLKHIIVDIYGNDHFNDDDLLSGFLSVFEDMRTKNIIETVTVENMDTNRRPGSDDIWGSIAIRTCVLKRRVTGYRDA